MKLVSRGLIGATAIALLSGWAAIGNIVGGDGKEDETPTVGNRVDILGSQVDSIADPALAGLSVILPPAQTNANWAQPGGNAAKSPGHVRLGQGLALVWSANVAGGSNRSGGTSRTSGTW